MKLQTKLPLQPAHVQFDYQDKLLLLGSCFSENIGAKLAYYKCQATTNPFGIIFNPVAIERLIEDAVLDKTYTEEDVFELEGVWKSYVAHSDLNALSRLGAVIHLQESQQLLRNQLQAATHLFITLGTAWVYRHKKSDQIVANCHKVPQHEFEKELLSVDEVTQSLSKLITLVKALNPTLQIIFTVSPVRHLKDGFIENTRSKSHLIAAVHAIVDATEVHYFPAFEIVMDELRDYRFYNSDMLHPSPQAIDYIWERFVEVYASAKTRHTMKDVQLVQQGLAHKSFHAESAQHQKFLAQLHQKKAALEAQYAFMKF